MKLVDKAAWLVVSKQRQDQNQARRKAARRRARYKQASIEGYTLETRSGKRVRFKVMAPTTIGLGHKPSHRLICRAAKLMRDQVLRHGNIVVVDFSGTQKLYVDGVLLLYAEICRVLRRRPGSLRCIPSKDPLVNETLKHIGLYEMLGYNPAIIPSHPDAVGWHFAHGERADAEEIGKVLEKWVPTNQKIVKTIYGGIEEALSNVPQHAYDCPRADGTGEPGESGWWMFVRETPSKLNVAFCDLGVGIPATLGTNNTTEERAQIERIKSSVLEWIGLRRHHDGTIIESAVRYSKSRTGQSHRGRGLGKMVRVLETVGNGRIDIMSNAGGLHHAYRDGESVPQVRKYGESIFGTLICWQLHIRESDDD